MGGQVLLDDLATPAHLEETGFFCRDLLQNLRVRSALRVHPDQQDLQDPKVCLARKEMQDRREKMELLDCLGRLDRKDPKDLLVCQETKARPVSREK